MLFIPSRSGAYALPLLFEAVFVSKDANFSETVFATEERLDPAQASFRWRTRINLTAVPNPYGLQGFVGNHTGAAGRLLPVRLDRGATFDVLVSMNNTDNENLIAIFDLSTWRTDTVTPLRLHVNTRPKLYHVTNTVPSNTVRTLILTAPEKHVVGIDRSQQVTCSMLLLAVFAPLEDGRLALQIGCCARFGAQVEEISLF